MSMGRGTWWEDFIFLVSSLGASAMLYCVEMRVTNFDVYSSGKTHKMASLKILAGKPLRMHRSSISRSLAVTSSGEKISKKSIVFRKTTHNRLKVCRISKYDKITYFNEKLKNMNSLTEADLIYVTWRGNTQCLQTHSGEPLLCLYSQLLL